MPTIDEIRTEWKGVRSALGNLICYMDGKVESLKSFDEAYQKGVNDGSLDVKERVSAAFQSGYSDGLHDAWEIATRIVAMDVHERAKVFFENAIASTAEEPFKRYTADEATQLLKAYDARKQDEDDLRFVRFLYNVIQPNEMEQYMAMYRAYNDPNYCPNCGANMRESKQETKQESKQVGILEGEA